MTQPVFTHGNTKAFLPNTPQQYQQAGVKTSQFGVGCYTKISLPQTGFHKPKHTVFLSLFPSSRGPYLGVALVDGVSDGLHKVVPHAAVRGRVPEVAALGLAGDPLQHEQQRAGDEQEHEARLPQRVPHDWAPGVPQVKVQEKKQTLIFFFLGRGGRRTGGVRWDGVGLLFQGEKE